jgi:dipeptidase
MCDTFVFQAAQATWFCKNSDREPDEPQRVEFHPAGSAGSTQRATYIEVPVPAFRAATLLSRPQWMWGAEIGVNEYGVAIGNQAVFTRLVERRGASLLGMDLLRLALEQARSSAEARDVIVHYLESFGQGGPAGYRDKRFRYDNGFLIADAAECWVLETAGRFWAARRVEGYAAISNDLSITDDYELCAAGMEDYARRRGWAPRGGSFSFRDAFRRGFMPFMGRAYRRRAQNLCRLAALDPARPLTERDFIPLLRHHLKGRPASNADVCMHSRGPLRPSATTNSLVARLDATRPPRVWSSHGQPCQNEYRQVKFDTPAD